MKKAKRIALITGSSRGIGAAIILHGSWGNPNENWFPWLKSELRRV